MMTTEGKRTALLIGFVGLAVLLMVRPVSAQESGAQVWGRTCNRCHRAQPLNKYQADEWRAIMRHMALNARLTPAEEDAVTEFLMSAARSVADASTDRSETVVRPSSNREEDPAPTSPDMVTYVDQDDSVLGRETYERQCVVCHGAEGKGNGPAARALKPRPADLTESEAVRTMSDAELLEFLTKGKGAMPAFGSTLSRTEMVALVKVLRDLNTTK
jgi:cytochrome c5